MITVIAIQCDECKDIIFSRTGPDMIQCSCKKTVADGGLDCEGNILKMSSTIGYRKVKIELNIDRQELLIDWKMFYDKFGIIKEQDLSKYNPQYIDKIQNKTDEENKQSTKDVKSLNEEIYDKLTDNEKNDNLDKPEVEGKVIQNIDRVRRGRPRKGN